MTRLVLAIAFGLALLALCGVGLFLSACSDRTETDHATGVLLVVVDTLRADRLDCYGGALGLTPNMDAFASEGVLFRNAYSHAPWTLPSFASLLTSTYPSQHKAGGRIGGFNRLRPETDTVGKSFQRAGFKTASVVNVDFAAAAFGMDNGFDVVDAMGNENNHVARIAAGTTDTALHWLDKMKGRPFFLLVHYFDPHLVYEPPTPFRERFARVEDRGSGTTLFGEAREILAFRQGKLNLDQAMIERLEALHNGEVAYTDQELGRLIKGLDERGLREKTVVVITADHGEEFFDHGGFEHGHTLYNELIHVPLLIRAPGRVPAGAEVDSVVRHIDLAPTLCALAGVDRSASFEGLDLSPLWERGAPRKDRPVFAEGYFWGPERHYCRVADDYKTIVYEDRKTVEIYNIKTDPAERHNLAPSQPALRKLLKADLDLVLTGMSIAEGEPLPAHLTPAQIDRLNKIGYGK